MEKYFVKSVGTLLYMCSGLKLYTFDGGSSDFFTLDKGVYSLIPYF